MAQRGVRTKREVSKEDLEKFLADNGPFEFDGLRYTKPEGMQGGTWKKPVASVEDDKFYLIED